MPVHLAVETVQKLTKIYGGSGGKRRVFNLEQKELTVEQERSSSDSEFQILGAA